MYPGKGTVVLIRPARTFYERIKLDDAGLISYLDDGNVHVNPRRSTAFYHYLRNLYLLLSRGMGNPDRTQEDDARRS